MSKRGKTQSYFEHEAYQNIEFVPFGKNIEIPKVMPSEEEVQNLFNTVAIDRDMRPDRRIWFQNRPIEQKWELYCDQVAKDAESPSPEYICSCLIVRPANEVFSCLVELLTKGRVSWMQQFLNIGGLNKLLLILSLYVEDYGEEIYHVPSDEAVSGTLHCLKAIANTRTGSAELINHPESIKSIILSINPTREIANAHALNLLLMFLFSDSEVTDSMSNCKVILQGINRLTFGWGAFVAQLQNRPDYQLVSAFASFLKGIYMINSKKPREHLGLTLSLVESGMDSVLASLKYEQGDSVGDAIKSIIDEIRTDIISLGLVFKEPTVNPFDMKSIVEYLKEQKQEGKFIKSIMISLGSIGINYKEGFRQVCIFIHNYLILNRFYLAQGDRTKHTYCISIAASQNKPLMIPYTHEKFQNNKFHKALHKSSMYLPDCELVNLSLSNFLEEGMSLSEVADESENVLIPAGEVKERLKKQKEESDQQLQLVQQQLEAIQDVCKQTISVKEEMGIKIKKMEEEKEKREVEMEEMRTRLEDRTLEEKVQELEEGIKIKENQNDRLQKQVVSMREDYEKLTEELLRKNEEYSTMKTEVEILRRNLEEERRKVEETENNKGKVNEKVKELETGKVKMQEEYSKLLNEKSEMMNQMRECESMNRQLEEEIKGLKMRNEEMKQKLDSLEVSKQMLEKEFAQRNEKISTLNSEISTSNVELATLRMQVNDGGENQRRLEGENEKLRERYDETKRQLNAVQSSLNRVEEEKEVLKQKVSDSEKLIGSLTSTTTVVQELQEQLKNREKEYEKMTDRCESLDTQLKDSKDRVSYLETMLEQTNSSRDELNKILNDANDKISTMNLTMINMESNKSELKNKVEEYEHMLSVKDAEMENLSTKLEESKGEINRLMTKCTRLENETNGFKGEIEIIKESEQKKKVIIEESQERVKELENELDMAMKRANDSTETLSNQVGQYLSTIDIQRQKIRELEEINQSVTQKEQTINNLRRQMSEITKVRDEALERGDRLESEVSGIRRELQRSEATIGQLRAVISATNTGEEKDGGDGGIEINVLKESMEQMKGEIGEKEEKINQQKIVVRQQEERIKELEREIEEHRNGNEQGVEALKVAKNRIQELEMNRMEMERELMMTKQEMNNTKTTLGNLESRLEEIINSCKSDKQQMQSTIVILEKEKEQLMNELNRSKENAEITDEKYKSTIASNERRIIELEMQINVRKSAESEEMNSMNEMIENMKREYGKEIERLEMNAKEYKEENEKQKGKIRELEENNKGKEEKESRLNEMEGEIKEWKERMKKSEENFRVLEEENSRLRQQNESSENQIALKTSLLEKNLGQAKEQIQMLDENIEGLKMERDSLKEKSEELERLGREKSKGFEEEKRGYENRIQELTEENRILKMQIMEGGERVSVDEVKKTKKKEILPKKENPVAPCFVRPVRWKVIGNEEASGTIWENLPSSKMVDKEKLIETFKVVGEPPVFVSEAKSRETNIFFSHLRTTVTQCIQGLYGLAQFFTIDHLQALETLIPNENELAVINAYNGDIKGLQPVDVFFKNLSRVPALKLRIDAMKLMQTFGSRVEQELPILESLGEGLEALKGSERVRNVLGIVVECGNVLNGGNGNGGVYGFDLGSIGVLNEVKSGNQKYTLMSYVSMLIYGSDELKEYENDLEKLMGCMNYDLEGSVEWSEFVSRTVSESLMEIPLAEGRVPEGDLFSPRFMEFYGENRGKIDEYNSKLGEVAEKYKEILEYFGTDEKTKMREFIGYFVKFVGDVRSAYKAAGGHSESRKSSKSSSKPSGPSEESERGILDSLVQNIQTGGSHGKKEEGKKQETSFFARFRR